MLIEALKAEGFGTIDMIAGGEMLRTLLVDDIFTSGATVSHCAKALKSKGASKVYVLTIARA